MNANVGAQATRLSLYAIISAIETDLRLLLRQHSILDNAPIDPFDSEQRKKLTERHEQYYGRGGPAISNTELLEYTDFFESYELLQRHKTSLSPDVASELAAARPLFESIIPIRNRVMHSRPLEFDDFSTVYDIAQSVTKHKGAAWPHTRSSLARLISEPSFVLSLRLPDHPWLKTKSTPHNLPLPEFDDTGYVGRVKDREDITKLILGHHQIVTILGEGGVGKTATLVKCLYDMLDDIHGRYDSVLWVSLKNQVLTASGVKDINNSIGTALGLYQAIARPLGATEHDSIPELLSDLRQHLEAFRILLVIDNLETIHASEILDFIRDLPPQTKLVITSRIGLGELERRRDLQPLNENEAVQLFRRHAQVYTVDALVKLPQHNAIEICRRLHCNALAIRWFVTSVQRGTPAEFLLRNKTDLLSFCVQNVFGKLSNEAKGIVQIMLAARKPLGESELAFLAGKTAIEVRKQLFEIAGTMMLRQVTNSLEDRTIETQYALSEFSRQYFEIHNRPPRDVAQSVARQLSELATAGELAGMDTAVDPFSAKAIRIRNNNDRVAARLLQQALVESSRRAGDRALHLVSQAKEFAPTYPEVYKISAFIKAHTGDLSGAQEDYEQAIELMPDAAHLYFLYAGFMAYKIQNSVRALDLIDRAAQLAPNNPQILVERARYLTFLGKFDEAWHLFSTLLGTMNAHNTLFQIKLYDKSLNCIHRMMERSSGLRDFDNALKQAARALELINDASEKYPFEYSFAHCFCDILRDVSQLANRCSNKKIIEQSCLIIIDNVDILITDKSFRQILSSSSGVGHSLSIDPALQQSLDDLSREHRLY